MDSSEQALSTGSQIARVRVPGGRVRAAQWEVLADLTDDCGDGDLYLTSRGNLQIRGVGDAEVVWGHLEGLGFAVPSEHSILGSPLSPALDDLIQALDVALLSAGTAGMSGGFAPGTLFGIDAGDGAIIGEKPDFGLIDTGGDFQLVLGGVPTGLVVEAGSGVSAVVSVVKYWQGQVGGERRVSEVPSVIPVLRSYMERSDLIVGLCDASVPVVSEAPAPIGWLQDGDAVALGAGLRQGLLGSRLARFLAAIERDITITPWNSLVIHGLSEGMADQVVKVLAPMGLIFDANSPELRV